MTKFKWVRWKNLFSYGNTWTKVDLNRWPSTVITGKNGHGKSVMFEALYICLFGVSIRPIKKAQWVNNKNNKGLEIETCFEVGEDEYVVRRAVKPDAFTITKNGMPLNEEASVREQQLILNRDILKTDKTGFQITTLISKSGIDMFMGLKAEERRKFIDNMLGTAVFTEMAKLHKIECDKLKAEVEETAKVLVRADTKVTAKTEELAKTKKMLDDFLESMKLAHQNKIAEAEKALQQVFADRDALSGRLQLAKINAEAAVQELEHEQGELSDAKDKLVEALFEDDVVPDLNVKRKELADWDKNNPIDAALQEDLDQVTEAYKVKKAESDAIAAEAETLAGTLSHKKVKLKEANLLVVQLTAKAMSLTGQMNSLKAGFCAECQQDVGEEHIAKEKAKILPKIEKVETGQLDLKNMIHVLEKDIEALEGKIDAADEVRRELEGLVVRGKQARKNIESAKELSEQKKLGVKSQVASLEREFTKANEAAGAAVRELEKRVEKLKLSQLAAHTTVTDILEEQSNFDDRVKAAEAEIEKQKAFEVVVDRSKVEELEAELVQLTAELDEVTEKRSEQGTLQNYQAVTTQMLKDTGFKAVVVKKFLPIVNRIVNEKLAEFGFHAKFKLDENFDEVITVHGTEYTFHQFSEGQKLRINLALIMAWREIGRMQGRMHSNLLMFDEKLDGSLDDDGYEALTEIFKLLDDLNVFIISHNSTKMENFVRAKMSMVFSNGFSRLGETVTS